MSRSPSRSSTRTLPPYSFAERAAGARGGTSPPSGRSAHGKPEPPPGFMPIGRAPPGRTSIPVENLRRSHGPPRQARGDPQSFAQAPPTYGFRSGPRHLARTSSHKDPHRHRGATGPPGTNEAGAVNCWSQSGNGSSNGAPFVHRQARRGPPGALRAHSSLSAGRCRERNPDPRPETGRHDVARKPKPKSRKITPWL